MIRSALLFLFFCLTAPALFSQRVEVKVGGYTFPPFVFGEDRERYSGLTLDLIEEMNRYQDKYLFRFIETTAKRRYRHLLDRRFDIIMFEDMNWGWKGYPVYPSEPYLDGGEVFIALAEPGRGQEFFDDISDKSIAVIFGFHYGFASFNADETYLRNHFNIQLNRDQDINILMVLQGKVDLSTITRSYLMLYLHEHPEARDSLLVSEKFDQVYHHTVLVGYNAPVTTGDMNAILDGMKKAGILDALWKRYGIE